MKKTLCKIVALCMCLAMLLISFAGCQNNESGQSNASSEESKATTPNQTEPPTPVQSEITLDGEFIIGLSAPMTGYTALYGKLVSNGAKLAVDQINDNGGIYGAKLKLEIVDDKGDASIAKSNYSILKNKGMHVSLGCVTSDALLQFATAADQDDMFILSTSSGSDMSSFDDVYQLCFSYEGAAKAAARYVNTLDVKQVGILYQSDDDYFSTLRNSFKQALEKDINIAESAFTYYDADFTDNANALKDCELIFICAYSFETSSFMNAAKEIVSDDAIYFGNDLDPSEAIGTSIPQKIIYATEFDKDSNQAKKAGFTENYTKLYIDDPSVFAAFAYDGVYAIADALKAAIDNGEELSPQTSPKDICKALKEQFNNGFKFSGVTGTDIIWTDTGSVVKDAFIITVKNFGYMFKT